MFCKYQDLVIHKKSKFFHVVELETIENSPMSLVDKTIKCQIKESTSTETYLFTLTEANEGIIIIDRQKGVFALSLSSVDTNIEADYGVYDIIELESDYIGLQNRVIMQGKIYFRKGVTI